MINISPAGYRIDDNFNPSDSIGNYLLNQTQPPQNNAAEQLELNPDEKEEAPINAALQNNHLSPSPQ